MTVVAIYKYRLAPVWGVHVCIFGHWNRARRGRQSFPRNATGARVVQRARVAGASFQLFLLERRTREKAVWVAALFFNLVGHFFCVALLVVQLLGRRFSKVDTEAQKKRS
jgi:hypothetical protein